MVDARASARQRRARGICCDALPIVHEGRQMRGNSGRGLLVETVAVKPLSSAYRSMRSTSRIIAVEYTTSAASDQARRLYCLRRGLGLKDGPGSARAAAVNVWLRWGFILSPSARTGPSRPGPVGEGRSDGGVLHLHPRGQARYPEGGRRREDEPPGKGVRIRANTRETTRTRAMSASTAKRLVDFSKLLDDLGGRRCE